MADIGNYFEKNKQTIVEIIDNENLTIDLPRPYLGMSQLGDECMRRLWFYFRWANVSEIDGRVNRLFKVGHEAEPKMIADLESIGVKTWDTLDAQAGFEAVEGYCQGHGDGMGNGIPGAEKTDHLLEFKTMADKYFKIMVKKGVKEAKPVYYAQIILYMYFTKTTRALFMCLNKNTSAYYTERVHADNNFAKELVGKAYDIIVSEDFNQFPKIGSGTPAYYECKFCNYSDQCHHDAKPIVTCRTCSSFKLVGGGVFACGLQKDKPLSTEEQGKACPNYNLMDCFLS